MLLICILSQLTNMIGFLACEMKPLFDMELQDNKARYCMYFDANGFLACSFNSCFSAIFRYCMFFFPNHIHAYLLTPVLICHWVNHELRRTVFSKLLHIFNLLVSPLLSFCPLLYEGSWVLPFHNMHFGVLNLIDRSKQVEPLLITIACLPQQENWKVLYFKHMI